PGMSALRPAPARAVAQFAESVVSDSGRPVRATCRDGFLDRGRAGGGIHHQVSFHHAPPFMIRRAVVFSLASKSCRDSTNFLLMVRASVAVRPGFSASFA